MGFNKIIFYLFTGFLTVAASFAQDFTELSGGSIHQIEVVIGTYLGGRQRNYYGNRAPDSLNVIWKHYLGKGKTVVSVRSGEVEWAGSGWTGQPLLIREDGKLFLVLGAYDHHLKKIDASTGALIWQYAFDDVIKGTATLWINPKAATLEESVLVLQGSRRGLDKNTQSKHVPSFRAISYFTGQELWRLDSPPSPSFSRDVDASALVRRDTVYLPLENASFVLLDPYPDRAALRDGMKQPPVLEKHLLYSAGDITKHGGNLVSEASPSVLDDRIYIASGSGHVYGYHLGKHALDWDFYTGSDMDGSPVVTLDSCLLIAVEKQYIPGKGGIFKLDPFKGEQEAVVWYFPTGDAEAGSWQGGVVGSASVNDMTRESIYPNLAAFNGIDGYLYVVEHQNIDTGAGTAKGPLLKKDYPRPQMVFKYKIGTSISTPIIVRNRIITAGYGGIYLFEFTPALEFVLLDTIKELTFESTPVVFDGRVYVGSRNGYLYCLGSAE